MRLIHGIIAALALAGFGHVSTAHAQTAYALTDQNTIISFDVASPGTVLSTVPITGLFVGDIVEGIDQRPANGNFVLLARITQPPSRGVGGVLDQGSLYTVDVATGAATYVADLTQSPDQDPATPPVILEPGEVSTDFNPVPDRLRAVSLNGQSLRINVDTGVTLIDGTFAFVPGDPNEGDVPAIIGVAYTNDVAPAPASTVLFALDALNDVHTVISPPNDGAVNTGGPFGIDIATPAGFAINTSGGINTAYVANGGNLYTLDIGDGTLGNPGSGALTLVGAITGSPAIIGLEVAGDPDPGPGPGPIGPAQPVPTAGVWALLLLALGIVGLMVWHSRRQSV